MYYKVKFHLFVSVVTGLVLTVIPVSAQTTNIDMSNDAKLLVRQLEMEASMKSMEEFSKKESTAAKEECDQSARILQQTLDRFYDCAPGLATRMAEWVAIRATIEVGGQAIFKNGNDSIYKNITKQMTQRMFTLPNAASMPGDVVWRRFKDAFIRAEKAFLGSSRISGVEDLLNTAMGATEGEATAVKGAVDRLGGGKDGNGILGEGFFKNDKLAKGYRDEVERVIDDVLQMHSSWVPSADKESYYQKKLQELNKLYARVRGSDWVDFILESEQTDRMNINNEYQKILDKSSIGRSNSTKW